MSKVSVFKYYNLNLKLNTIYYLTQLINFYPNFSLCEILEFEVKRIQLIKRCKFLKKKSG